MAQLFPSETLLWRIVPKNKMQNKIQFRKSRSTWEQSCQSHPLTNIQTFICDFAREMTIFNRNACNYQTATRWDLPLYRITIWLIDDMMLIFVCLLVDLILGFVTAFWHEKPMDSNSHRLSSLYYNQTEPCITLEQLCQSHLCCSLIFGMILHWWVSLGKDCSMYQGYGTWSRNFTFSENLLTY